MATDTAPSPNFNGIDFNPDFFSTSTSLTLAEADTLYLNKSVADTANVLETFTVGISANALQATTGLIDSLSVLGVLTSNYVDSIGTTLSLGYSNATTITSDLPLYVNSYYFTGTAPTLSKSSMNYFVNCPVASTGNIAVSKYIYSPSSNSSTGNSHYFPPGIYDVDINAYFYAIGSPTIASGSFVMGASTGTNIQAMPANSQYGVINIQSPTIPFANTGAINLNSQSFGYSHKGCFVLTSSAFINVEVFINSLTITGGNINMNVYGVVKRIG